MVFRTGLKKLTEHFSITWLKLRSDTVLMFFDPSNLARMILQRNVSPSPHLMPLETWRGSAPKINLMIVLPNQIKGLAPLFLAMNFCGNHALDPDPRIPLAKYWLYNNCKGCTNNAATAASRGGQAVDWPLAEI